MTTTLRLLGRRPSINVRKVLWTLDEVGLPYRFEEWETDLSPARLAERHGLNPNDKFPILIDQAGPLWESNTICRYLVGAAGRDDLLPAAPRARAEVERWIDWQATDLNSAWVYAFHALQRRTPGYADPSAIADSIKAWNDKIVILEGQLDRTRAFIAGDGFTLADIVIGLSAHRWFGTPMVKPQAPRAKAYLERLKIRPCFTAHANEALV
jgi:glutathione S-transferase